jgi:hypothetical protein
MADWFRMGSATPGVCTDDGWLRDAGECRLSTEMAGTGYTWRVTATVVAP